MEWTTFEGSIFRCGFGTGLAAGAAAMMLACGGSSTTPSPPPPPPTCSSSSNTTTIVISNNSVCPQNITVARGSQVTFVNQDSREHDMYSDPHPEHTGCPELNQVGTLMPGQSRQTGNLVAAGRCGFHDHLHPDMASLKGSITIQ